MAQTKLGPSPGSIVSKESEKEMKRCSEICPADTWAEGEWCIHPEGHDADGDYWHIFPADTRMLMTPEYLGR